MAVLTTIFAGFAFNVSINSRSGSLFSQALGESRAYRAYFEGSDRALYILDGQMDRNAWVAASFYSFGSLLRGKQAPTIIAVHSGSNRDIDFRNGRSDPSDWRPVISGRAQDFDRFLLDELLPHIEENRPRDKTLSGFSLSGLYSIDFVARHPDAFMAVQAFSPTFSHDKSIVGRLQKTCESAGRHFVSWGLESRRDTAVFEEAMKAWSEHTDCADNPPIDRRHFGVIHPLIMVSGHFERAFVI